MRGTILTRRAKYLVAGILAATSVAAYAYSTDVQNGATAPSKVSSGSNSGYWKFVTDDQASSRTEFRGSDTTGTRTASGTFRVGTISATGGKVSVIQVLNKVKPNSQGKSSQPIAQLAVEKVSGGYKFFIVQKARSCSVPTFTSGNSYYIKTTFKRGSTVAFSIKRVSDGKTWTCTSDSYRQPGKATDGLTATGTYYAKLGAYNTASTTPSATMYWKDGFNL